MPGELLRRFAARSKTVASRPLNFDRRFVARSDSIAGQNTGVHSPQSSYAGVFNRNSFASAPRTSPRGCCRGILSTSSGGLAACETVSETIGKSPAPPTAPVGNSPQRPPATASPVPPKKTFLSQSSPRKLVPVPLAVMSCDGCGALPVVPATVDGRTQPWGVTTETRIGSARSLQL